MAEHIQSRTMKKEAYNTQLDKVSQIQNLINKEIGISNWIEITQEKINTFAEVTEDEQWIHTDVPRSQKESPYKTPIAHGFLILSYASRIAYDCLTLNDLVMGVNYGLNKVRFINAVTAGSKIRGRLSILDYEEIPKGAKYILNMIFEIEGQEKPACVAEIIGLAYIS